MSNCNSSLLFTDGFSRHRKHDDEDDDHDDDKDKKKCLNSGNNESKSCNSEINVKSHNFGIHFGSNAIAVDPILDSIRHENHLDLESGKWSSRTMTPKRSRRKSPETGGPGLSEILSMPEMLINKQISPGTLKKYVASERCRNGTPFSVPSQGRLLFFF